MNPDILDVLSYSDSFEPMIKEQRQNEINIEARQGFWRTKEDKVILINELKASHTQNIIRMLQRDRKSVV